MREADQSLAFYQETSDLRKVHKNRQNSVDSITDIRFHVGMDARQMKKAILLEALDLLINMDEDRVVRLITNNDNPTQAAILRYRKLINEMHDKAQAALD